MSDLFSLELLHPSVVLERPMAQIYGLQQIRNSSGGVIFGSHFTIYTDVSLSRVLAAVNSGVARAYRLPRLAQMVVRSHRPSFVNADALGDVADTLTPPVFLNRTLTSASYSLLSGTIINETIGCLQLPYVSSVLWDARLLDNTIATRQRCQAYYHPFVNYGLSVESGGMVPLPDSSVASSFAKQLQFQEQAVTGFPYVAEGATRFARQSTSTTSVSRRSGILMPIASLNVTPASTNVRSGLLIEAIIQSGVGENLGFGQAQRGFGAMSAYIAVLGSIGLSLGVPFDLLTLANSYDRVWSFDLSTVKPQSIPLLTAAPGSVYGSTVLSNTLDQLDPTLLRLFIPAALWRDVLSAFPSPGATGIYLLVAPAAPVAGINMPMFAGTMTYSDAEPYSSPVSTTTIGTTN